MSAEAPPFQRYLNQGSSSPDLGEKRKNRVVHCFSTYSCGLYQPAALAAATPAGVGYDFEADSRRVAKMSAVFRLVLFKCTSDIPRSWTDYGNRAFLIEQSSNRNPQYFLSGRFQNTFENIYV